MGNYLFLAQNNLHFCVANHMLLRFFSRPFSHILIKKKLKTILSYSTTLVGQNTREDSNSFFVKPFDEQLL